MRHYKRLTLLCGHYGSGKTNVAVNMAYDLRKQQAHTAIADLDIVNPYFRSKDSAQEFARRDIRLICSEYANTNVDIPAMPAEMYTLLDDRELYAVIDVGGDDRGAYALGRLADRIKEEGDYEMLMVINRSRPLTPDAASTIEVMREIEAACHIPFTGLVNNTNLGEETTAADVLSSLPYAEEVAALSGLPVVLTAVRQELYGQLEGKIPHLFPLQLQEKPFL